MTYTLRREQIINKPRSEVFKFFEKAENLEEITPKSVGFNILTPKPVEMKQGAIIDYRIKLLFGIPVNWKTEILEYDPPNGFIDNQIKGPYSLWHHTHTFIDKGDKTLMIDEVKYKMPLGILGSIAHAIYVKNELKNIFDYRYEVIENIFKSNNKGEKMKVVIAGGSGFVGKSLIDELRQKGNEVVLLTRDPDKVSITGIDVVRWDGKHAGGWEKTIDGADAVVNLSGEYIANRWTDEYKKKILNSRIDTTTAIANAIKKADKKPKVLVNASAVGYYGAVESGDVTEDSPKGDSFLADTCVKWEEAADAVEESGTRLVKLRIGIVLEKGSGALSKMVPPFLMFAGGPLGSGKQWFPWIHRDDVVGSIIYAIENESVVGPVNATAPNPVDMKDFCKALGKSLKRPSWAPVPGFALKALLGEMSDMLLTGQKAVPLKLKKYGYEFKYPEVDKALDAILN